VAIDAVAAKLMGFDPLDLPYIRLAHDAGLGVGDPRDIELVGDTDLGNESDFSVGDNGASEWAISSVWADETGAEHIDADASGPTLYSAPSSITTTIAGLLAIAAFSNHGWRTRPGATCSCTTGVRYSGVDRGCRDDRGLTILAHRIDRTGR